jgi:hypothetical protein
LAAPIGSRPQADLSQKNFFAAAGHINAPRRQTLKYPAKNKSRHRGTNFAGKYPCVFIE